MTIRVIAPVLAGFALYGAVDVGVIALIIAKLLPISFELLLLFVAIDIASTLALIGMFIAVAVARPTRMGLVAIAVVLLAMICLTAFNMFCAYLALANAG